MPTPKQIKSLSQLVDLARERRAVTFGESTRKPLPAAVVINWQGHTIYRAMQRGMWVYEKAATHK